MGEPLLGGAICAGTATAIGSLPHRDAHAAAALTLRCLPELPAVAAAPAAIARARASSRSGPARCRASSCTTTATIEITAALDPLAPLQTVFDAETHAGC